MLMHTQSLGNFINRNCPANSLIVVWQGYWMSKALLRYKDSNFRENSAMDITNQNVLDVISGELWFFSHALCKSWEDDIILKINFVTQTTIICFTHQNNYFTECCLTIVVDSLFLFIVKLLQLYTFWPKHEYIWGRQVRAAYLPLLCTNESRVRSPVPALMCTWFPVQTCFRRFFSGHFGFPPASKTGPKRS